MKRKILLFIILICMMVFISSCGKKNQPPVDFDGNGNVTDLGDDDTAFVDRMMIFMMDILKMTNKSLRLIVYQVVQIVIVLMEV